VKDFDHALHLLYTDPELKGCPFDMPHGRHLCVPTEAAKLIRKKARGLGIRVEKLARVLDSSDLSPEELARFQHDCGM
jgi:hypothetical protein